MNVQKQNTSAGGTQRLAALDWMRGFLHVIPSGGKEVIDGVLEIITEEAE